MRLIPRRTRKPHRPPRTASIFDDDGARLGALRWHDARLRARHQFTTAQWQREVLGYIDDGPGVSGWYVDQVGKLLGSAELFIEEFDPRANRWVDSDYGPAYRIMNRVRTKDGDIHDLIRQAGVDLEGVAETHLWLDQDSRHGWIYGTATSNQIERQSPETLIVRDRADADIGDREYRTVPIRQVVSLIWGSASYPAEPGNQMRRSLPDLRAYAKATRGIERSFDSRLIMNGIVGMEFAPGTLQAAADEVVKNYEKWAARGFTQDDSIAAHAPFVAVGPKVTHADTGHDVTVGNIEAATLLLRQWARSFDWPTRWIVEGPGDAKYANEALLREEVLAGSAGPRERRLMGMLTETILRPWARELSIFDRDPSLFRARLNIGALATPEDKTTDMLAIADRIAIRREVLAEQVGLNPATDLLELPPGMSETDLWLATLQRGGAAAEAANSPTGRGPGQGNQGSFPIRAALGPADDEVVDAVVVPADDEIESWHDDDALLV